MAFDQKEEGYFAAFAAIVVLICAIWGDPWIAAIIAIIALLFFAEQSFANSNEEAKEIQKKKKRK